MTIKIGAFGYGVAAILAVGSILLAALNNPAWTTMLGVAVLIWIISLIAKKI